MSSKSSNCGHWQHYRQAGSLFYTKGFEQDALLTFPFAQFTCDLPLRLTLPRPIFKNRAVTTVTMGNITFTGTQQHIWIYTAIPPVVH